MRWYMNEENQLIQNAIHEFAQQRVRPFVDKMEKEEAAATELVREMGELGFLALGKPEQYGGAGEDQMPVTILMEELGRESYAVALVTMIQHIFINEMLSKCSEEQKQKFVVPAITGDKIIALAGNEPSGGMYFDGYSTKAKKEGDEWLINGGKCLITQVDQADVFIVSALTSDKVDPMTFEGYSTFLVPADTEGISIGHIENKVGWKGSRTGTIYFNDVRVPAENMTPTPLFTSVMFGLGAWYGAVDLGGCETCLEKTKEILKGRIQAGGVSLWDAHETARADIASLTMKVDMFRNSLYSHTQNINDGEATALEDTAYKVEGAKLLTEVAHECMILCGGAGLIYETGIERFYRDAPVSEIGCGSSKTMTSLLSWML